MSAPAETMPISVELMLLPGRDPALPPPDYATAGAAGIDLQANLPPADRATGWLLAPGARRLVPTGLAIGLPPGFEAQMRPRSGLALREGLTLLNSPGTIDADYRGELEIILVNHGQAPVTIAHGARIAQMVVAPVTRVAFFRVEALDTTARGAGGFGSTGVAGRPGGEPAC